MDELPELTTGLKRKRDHGKRGKREKADPNKPRPTHDKHGRPLSPHIIKIMAKPGEVRNPLGKNQYTYRQNFDEAIDKLLHGRVTDAELQLLLEIFPPNFREILDTVFGKAIPTRGELLALREIWWTLRGVEPSTGRALARIWPATMKIEDQRPSEGAPPRPLSSQLADDLRALGEKYARERGTVVETTATEVGSADSQS